jgi:DNA-binding protein H-NS
MRSGYAAIHNVQQELNMALTLAQITKQIEKLQKEADVLRKAELKGVVERIKVAISHYGLTPDQLGFGKPAVVSTKTAKATTSTKSSGEATAPQFANGEGQVWSGRGPRPHWLRDALANGRSLEEFRTSTQKSAAKPAPKAAAAAKQDVVIGTMAPPAKSVSTAKRTKAGSKKAGIAATPASGEVVPAHANAVDTAAPKTKRQPKAGSSKSVPAKKGRPTKAASAAVKSASQPKTKTKTKTKRLKTASATVKNAVAPRAEGSSTAGAVPAGAS